jgi:acyl carrier protein
VKEQITRYFQNLPAYRENPFHLRENDSLLALGLIDSFGILEFVSFLEKDFGVECEPEDMTRSNFESLAAIYRFVESKLNGRPVQPV